MSTDLTKQNTPAFRRAIAEVVDMARAGIGRIAFRRGEEYITNTAAALLDAAARV